MARHQIWLAVNAVYQTIILNQLGHFNVNNSQKQIRFSFHEFQMVTRSVRANQRFIIIQNTIPVVPTALTSVHPMLPTMRNPCPE